MDLILSSAQEELLARVSAQLSGLSGKEFEPAAMSRWASIGVPDLAQTARPEDVLAVSLAVTEAARLGVLGPLGLSALVLPLFAGAPAGAVPALTVDGAPAIVRYGREADLLIRIEGETTQAYVVDPAASQPADAEFVYPLGYVSAPQGAALGSAPSSVVLRRVRIALAAELVGILDSCLSQLKAFLSERRQFGRPLAGFQAIHHRLSEMAIDLESGRWLARNAAWSDDAGTAAAAAAYLCRIARRYCFEAHQLAGARGFTLELGLGRDTMRLHYLSVENGGPKQHEADAFDALWPVAA